jgi:hypothetical protein
MYRIKQYPTTFPVRSQQTNPGFTQSTFTTSVEELGKSEYNEMDLIKLQVIHQIVDKFEGKGFLEDGSQYDLVAVSTTQMFPCFVQGKEYLYSTGTTRTVSEQGLSRLKRFPEKENQLLAEPIKLNLIGYKEYLESNGDAAIKGGWFRGMKIANVEVAYLGGGTVTESSDWARFETSGGTISALRLDIPTPDPDEEKIKILLTKDGNCVIYRNYGELELLKIAIPIFEGAKGFLEREE